MDKFRWTIERQEGRIKAVSQWSSSNQALAWCREFTKLFSIPDGPGLGHRSIHIYAPEGADQAIALDGMLG